ncbi:MAG: PSD1 and planctomycete cytochrome C domain-containing protein [Akkermansiaceae bacterium]|nr:PSD1 and planctomycete cytochrome C domain-containing protein [Akkermansiaceae bacterium]
MFSRFIFALTLGFPSLCAKVSFNDEIRPLLSNSCYRCHGPDEEDRKAKLRLDTREGATKDHEGFTAISPGKIEDSELIYRIVTDDEDEMMPPPGKGERFTKEQIELFKRWIEEGAEYEVHWSYAKPVRPEVPQVDETMMKVRNPVDSFILSRLSKEGLSPSKEADAHTLIRRVALDLTGLPPTKAEVEAFLADESAKAYENLVNRLLAKPAFGEHWARMWLDLARYADSAGYADDPGRTIWAYRDWVIRAFNENMPFDQFTIDQIAGDLVSTPTEDQLVATAFHRNTKTNNEGGTSDEEFRNAAVVDRVNTTMATWMGTTAACAQCHTHKYDPISHAEYFQMFAIFNQSEDADRRNEAPIIQVMGDQNKKQVAHISAEIAKLKKEMEPAATLDLEAFAEWEAALKAKVGRWDVLTPRKMTAVSGANFKAGSDGSVLVSGKTAGTDDYTISASSKLKKITAIKIEALAYDKLGSGGPGRNGNFVINEVELTSGKTKASFLNASSTYDQDKFGAASAIDGNAGSDSGWAVGGSLGQDHHIVIELDKPLDGRNLELRLLQRYPNHALGRFRILATDSAGPSMALSSDTIAILKTSPAKRSAAERAQLVAVYRKTNPSVIADTKKLADLKKQLAAVKPLTSVPIMRDLPKNKHRKTHIQLRGSYLSLGEEVAPGVPQVFGSLPKGSNPDRLAMAKWLVDQENPLTARVVANRFWENLFGVGIVLTSEEFGSQGERPSHPELLDWLAVEFMGGGWDVKSFLRLLVTSSAYRQNSHVSDEMAALDPDNRLVARGPRVRLSAEMIRDQALAVSGLLSSKMYGVPVRPPQPNLGLKAAFGGGTDWSTSSGEDKFRRGLYTSWRRSSPYPSMATFGAPNREVCTVRRGNTNTPLQALVTLNDPVYIEAAQALSRRMAAQKGTVAEMIKHGFQLCLSRYPNEIENSRLIALYDSTRSKYATDQKLAREMATNPIGPLPKGIDVVELATLTVVANVLLNLDETLMKR